MDTIPTLVLSSSRQDSDIRAAYERGANGYLTKPPTFDGLVELMRQVTAFWLSTVLLPPLPGRRGAESGPS
jgi:two-component system response regulator